MRLKHINLLIIGVLLGFNSLASQQIKQNKRIVRTYKVNPEIQVEVINKYGKVEIIQWEKDSVKFVINLETKAKTKEKIDKLEALLNFSFQGGENYIRAKTLVGNESNDLMSEITNLTNAIYTIGAEVNIDYTVYMPATNKLKIINSFGDVFMGNFNPNLQIELSHGDLRTGKLNSFSIIDLKFSKAFIEYLKEGKIKISYGDLTLTSCKMLDIESKVSNIDINEVEVLSINSRKDDFRIGTLNYLKGSSNFSKINVKKFNKEMKLTLKYGSVNLDKISKLFSSMDINSNYTDITLIFEEGAGYDFTLTETDLSFSYPKEKSNLNKVVVDKDKSTFKYSGTIGKANTKSKVLIRAEKGSVKIFQE